jgi:hypothetical protein
MTSPTRLDPLTVLLDLLADHGVDLDPDVLQANTSPAGHLPRPLRDSGDLTACQIGACERLLDAVHLRRYLLGRGHGAATGLTYLMACARATGLLLPPAMADWAGRYQLVPDADGHLPHLQDLEDDLARAADTLTGYLREHDADQWVDPNAVAGAVADVLDAARVVLALTDVDPTVG